MASGALIIFGHFLWGQGIYEALEGNFLDSKSLSMLNPYMVSFQLLHKPLYNHHTYALCSAAELELFLVISKGKVSKKTVQRSTRFY